MMLALLPGVASADHLAEDGDFCSFAADASFPDVAEGGVFEAVIECGAGFGFFAGDTSGNFNPAREITRGEAAIIVSNFLEISLGSDLTVAAENPFDDVSETGEARDEILKLVEADVIEGKTSTTFAPQDQITRGESAALIYRALEFLGVPLDNTDNDQFSDIDGGIFENEIEALANFDGAAQVVVGFEDGTFRPGLDVLRGEFAQLVTEAAYQANEAGLFAPVGPPTNQTFSVTPNTAATNEVSTASSPNLGSRTYSVSGLDNAKSYNIALFPSDEVSVDSNGSVTFGDNEGTAGEADNIGTTDTGSAVIETVNGVTVAASEKHVGAGESEISPNNGVITFTIDSTAFDRTVPVVYEDADNDDQIDLASNDTPTEAVGVGGMKTWVPAQAADGAIAAGLVQLVDKDANYFVLGGLRYNYDDGDVYTYDGNNSSFSQFETALSAGDTVGGTYSRNFQSTFNSTDDVPGTPTGLAAQVGDFDDNAADTSSDDARFTWVAPNPVNGLIASYSVEIREDDNDAATACSAGTLAATATTTSGSTLTIDAEELAADVYCAYVFATSVEGSPGSSSNVVTFTVGTPAAAAPVALDTVQTTSGGLANTLDNGDVFKVVFNEAMAAPTSGDSIRVQDSNTTPTVGDIVNGTNATFTLNASAETVNGLSRAANTVLTVTLTADPTIQTVGTTAGVQLPATITDQGGTTDVGGAAWNLAAAAADTDLQIDSDTADTEANAQDVTAPAMSSANGTDGGASADVVTLTYSEAVRCEDSPGTPAQWVYDADSTDAVVGVAATDVDCDSVGGTTVTLTFPTGTFAPAAANDVVTYTAGANPVQDTSNNAATTPQTVSVSG